jgi:dTDP-4-dehydrorhamnose reductase/UDP-glucose 4-epimerase
MPPDQPSILLVGAGSLLGRGVLDVADGAAITAVSHDRFDAAMARDHDVVVNMAYDPRHMREAYDPARDFDRKVAEAVAGGRGHFVMLSTRKVYGPGHEGPIGEDAPCRPADAYGRNKLETEGAVRALLGNRATILRLANVFGFEPGRHTFLGIALENLKVHGRITLDANPFVQKDFIPLSDCAMAILSVIRKMPSGTFNLGYGTATEIGRIAMWLIEGFGRGELVVSSAEERDSFLLDTSRLQALGLLPEPRKPIRQCCVEIGERLRNA